MADLNLFLSPHKVLWTAPEKIFKEIFLFYHEIVCYVYTLELPHWGNSNEYTQHIIL